MTEYDFESAENRYIYGEYTNEGVKTYPTLRNIAKNLKIPMGTLGKLASKNEWKAQRETNRKKIETKVSEKKTEYEANKIVKTDEKFELAGINLLNLTTRQMKFCKNKQDEWEKKFKKDPNNPDLWKWWVKPYDLMNLGKALKDAQDTVKEALGDKINHIEVNTGNINEDMLNDPLYIATKRQAVDDYYRNKYSINM